MWFWNRVIYLLDNYDIFTSKLLEKPIVFSQVEKWCLTGILFLQASVSSAVDFWHCMIWAHFLVWLNSQWFTSRSDSCNWCGDENRMSFNFGRESRANIRQGHLLAYKVVERLEKLWVGSVTNRSNFFGSPFHICFLPWTQRLFQWSLKPFWVHYPIRWLHHTIVVPNHSTFLADAKSLNLNS